MLSTIGTLDRNSSWSCFIKL